MSTLPFNASRENFQGQFFSLCCSYQDNISQVIRSFFYTLCLNDRRPVKVFWITKWPEVWNSLHTCIYLSLSIFIDLSINFKIVWPQVCFSMCRSRTCSRKCHHSKEKGTVTKAKSLFVGNLEIFLKIKNFAQRKLPDTICLLFVFKALLIIKVFSLTIYSSTQRNRKTIITTEVLSFLSVIIYHFHLISFTGLTLRTETNDNHCKLKKRESALRHLGLLFAMHSN